MSAEGNSPPVAHSRITYSCIRCASRKVKCDRQRPCNQCIKRNEDCVFNPQQPPRRRKRVKVQALAGRLKYYEALLQEQGVDLDKLPETLVAEPPAKASHDAARIPKEIRPRPDSSVRTRAEQYVDETQAPDGDIHFRYVENTLWKKVVEEADYSPDTIDGYESSDLEVSEDDHIFLFSDKRKSRKKIHHPSPDHIFQLWKIFTENVDPLTKIVHVPTLRPAIEKAANNPATVPRSFEALMCSIYSTAIMSLKDDECKQHFSESRKALLSKYTSATETALSRAKVMGTTSLVTFQAFMLYLVSIREIYEPRTVWSLTGIAVRIAQVMGLPRDGEALGLPPFETEMRRRLWWQLKFHDFRTAELCGLAKFRDLDTIADATKWPANVNDNQLFPGMTSIEPETNTMTDAVFVAIRCELTKFAAARVAKFRQLGIDISQWNLDALDNDKEEIERTTKELEDVLESKYLRYCDPSQPLHLLTLLITRYGLNVIRFLRHHPRRWATSKQIPPSERQFVWEVSLKLVEQYNMAHSNPLLKRFAWHSAYFQQWHSIIHVLDTLHTNPTSPDADKAWGLINQIYENNSALVQDMKKPIHVAVGNLCLKAYESREAAMRNGNIFPHPTPEHIVKLRQHREAAKAKKEAREAQRRRLATQRDDNQPNDHTMVLNSDMTTNCSNSATESSSLPLCAMSDQPGFTQPMVMTENDPFYFFTGLDNSQSESPDMNWDFGPLLDTNMLAIDTNPVTWEQWDAWLATSNIMASETS